MLGNNGTNPHQRFFAFLSYFLFSYFQKNKKPCGQGGGRVCVACRKVIETSEQPHTLQTPPIRKKKKWNEGQKGKKSFLLLLWLVQELLWDDLALLDEPPLVPGSSIGVHLPKHVSDLLAELPISLLLSVPLQAESAVSSELVLLNLGLGLLGELRLGGLRRLLLVLLVHLTRC